MQKPSSSRRGRQVHPLLIHVAECESYTPGELNTVADKVKDKETVLTDMDPRANINGNDGGKINSQWQEFVDDTTFHGIKYVFIPKKQRFRRLIWLCLVVTAIGLFTYQVVERTQYYLAYHSTVSMKRVHTKSLDFPAVTICNLNSYRLTKTAELGLYYYIHDIYSNSNLENGLPDGIESSNITDILLKTAHQVEDLITSCAVMELIKLLRILFRRTKNALLGVPPVVQYHAATGEGENASLNCTWKGNPCNIPVDFKPRFTRQGVCYTFNGNNESLKVTQSGSGFGLRLILNIEAYEYMKGPEDVVGIKVLLHDPKEQPLVKDLGFPIAHGTHTLIGVKQTEVNDLPKPHGNCYSEAAPMSNCMFQSRALKIASECKCKESFLQSVTEELPPCNMTETITCVLREWYNMTEEDVNYTCPVPCQQITYEPVLSYSPLWKLSFPNKLSKERQSKVMDDYVHAREVARRVDRVVAEEDLKKIRTMKEKADSYQKNISNSISYLVNDGFSRWREILPIINTSYNIIRKEIRKRTDANVHMKNFKFGLEILFYNLIFRYDYFHKFSDTCINVNTTTNLTADQTMYTDCYRLSFNLENVMYSLSVFIRYFIITRKTTLNSYIDGNGHFLNRTGDDQAYVTCMNKRLDINGSWALNLDRADKACKLFSSSEPSDFTTRIQAIENLIDFFKWFTANVSSYTDVGCSLPEQQKWDKLKEISQQFELAIQGNIHDAIRSCLISNNQSAVNEIELFNSLNESYQEGCETKTKRNGYFYSELLNKTINNITAVHKRCKSLTIQYIKTLEGMINMLSLINKHGPDLLFQQIWSKILDKEDNRNCIGEFDSMINKTLQELKKKENDTDMKLNELENVKIQCFKGTVKLHQEQLQKQLNDSDKEIGKLEELIVQRLKETAKAKFTDHFIGNYIKMDIFYRSLSYEEISKQTAFEFLSLLSEIGGFLGLLLGASVLTVFELLDYLVVVAFKKCKTTNECFFVKN